MTCKDCKSHRNCANEHKSYKYCADGDSWAHWCDDFKSKHRSRSITKNGYTVTQSGYNWHIHIADNETGSMVMHAACNKRMSKRELSKMLNVYKTLLQKSDLIYADDESEV